MFKPTFSQLAALKKSKISCIVPVFNNQTTVKKVVTILRTVPEIKDIILINDGSKDASERLLKKFHQDKKITVITTTKNKGKGWAVALGIQEAKEKVIMICDADLCNLQTKHIRQMIDTFNRQKLDMVISSRGPIKSLMSKFFAWVSGERIFYKKNLHDQHFKLMKKCGNGVEQIINYAHRDKKVGFVVADDVGHILKYQRSNFPTWFFEYSKETWALLKTEAYLKFTFSRKVNF